MIVVAVHYVQGVLNQDILVTLRARMGEEGLPLGSVRKGLPCEELVSVAVARRPWKSLEDLVRICV